MASHFLLSAASRALSPKAIYKGGEDAAYEAFCKMRWPETEGEACAHQFSVTSGTIFASRKMAFVDLLAAICIMVRPSLRGAPRRVTPGAQSVHRVSRRPGLVSTSWQPNSGWRGAQVPERARHNPAQSAAAVQRRPASGGVRTQA